MNLSHTILNELINDKNAVIESQNLIMEGIHQQVDSAKDLEEIKGSLSLINVDISKLTEELEQAKGRLHNHEKENDLTQEYKPERETNAHLNRTIGDQIVYKIIISAPSA